MKYNKYDLKIYQKKHFEPVVKLQKYLWSSNFKENLEHFRWKYEENPYADTCPGIIAMFKGEVVGCRCFYPTRWKIHDNKNYIDMLSPTDTVVHPEHRRQGLFEAMTKMAIKEYQNSKYKAFINLSANKFSAAGNLKLGWAILDNRTYLRKYNSFGLIRHFLYKKKILTPNKDKLTFGRKENFEVTDKPKLKEMINVIQKQKSEKIRLFKDMEYLKYRYAIPKNNYFFYYLWKNEKIVAYIMVKPTKERNNAHILDFAESDKLAIIEILRKIIATNNFDIISVLNSNLGSEFLQALKSLGFNLDNYFEKLEKKLEGEFYLLVRPIKERVNEEDWFIDGVDIRNVRNWDINEFCTDPDWS